MSRTDTFFRTIMIPLLAVVISLGVGGCAANPYKYVHDSLSAADATIGTYEAAQETASGLVIAAEKAGYDDLVVLISDANRIANPLVTRLITLRNQYAAVVDRGLTNPDLQAQLDAAEHEASTAIGKLTSANSAATARGVTPPPAAEGNPVTWIYTSRGVYA